MPDQRTEDGPLTRADLDPAVEALTQRQDRARSMDLAARVKRIGSHLEKAS